MDIVKVNLAAVNVKLEKIDEKMEKNEKKVSENVKTAVESLVAKVEWVQDQLNNLDVREDLVEMKKSLNEMTKQIERITQQILPEIWAEEAQMKKGTSEAIVVGREPKVVLAGGLGVMSVEMFSLSNGTWTRLQPMRERREKASSVVCNNEFIVMGGWFTKSMEKLSLNAVQVDQSITWETVPAELPGRLAGHCSVVYNGRLIAIGGYDADKGACSDHITEISLVPPCTFKVLATMPQKKYCHGVAIFGDKIVIVGGRVNLNANSTLRTVVIYDITKGQFKALPPLPYPVSDMATVKWGDDNVIIIGGVDSNDEPLNTVFIYNVETHKSHVLPDMKCKRYGCVAAVVRDTVIVMGGADEGILKSAESFRFDRYTWEKLPEMHERRWRATAAVC